MPKSNQKPDGRGGKRAGAGRKPGRDTLSVRQLKEFERAATEMAKEYGETLQVRCLKIAYDDDAPRKDQLAAMKLFWDKSVIVAKEGGEADKTVGPAVFLPDRHPRLEVIDGGKSSDTG